MHKAAGMNHRALMDSPRCSAMPPTAEAPSNATNSQIKKVAKLVFMVCRQMVRFFVRQCYRKKARVCNAIHVGHKDNRMFGIETESVLAGLITCWGAVLPPP